MNRADHAPGPLFSEALKILSSKTPAKSHVKPPNYPKTQQPKPPQQLTPKK
jgi:hypothetical protein